jgi:RHS repeat-associated protein
MEMPGRKGEATNSDYRYGFNGMEKDDEVKGEGNSYDFGARMYDNRLGRWYSMDKVVKPFTPYQFGRANPVIYIDPDGNDDIYINADGTWSANKSSGDHKFFWQDGDGYELMIMTPDDASAGQMVGQFFASMIDMSDLNYVSEFVDDHKDLQVHLQSRQTTTYNKGLSERLVGYEDVVEVINVIELATGIGGVAKAVSRKLLIKATTKVIATKADNVLINQIDNVAPLADDILKSSDNAISVIDDVASQFDDAATKACENLGFYPSDIMLKKGVAEIPITYSTTFDPSDIAKVSETLKNAGATSLKINSGPISNTEKLLPFLEKLSGSGRKYQGFTITKTGNPDNLFILEKGL